MGVKGLTTFIDRNQHLLTDVRLHDTTILIDGNNLFHFIYFYFNISHQYGGNYDTFAAHIRYFFSVFRQCGIKSIVVFDGGHDVSNRKLQTSFARAKDRIHTVYEISHSTGRLFPLLGQDAFRQTLDEIGVDHVTCDFEADEEIAALGLLWNYPVLTNDSDFFIFNLSSGVILLDYLNLNMKSVDGNSNGKCLIVQMFYVEKFCEKFKLCDPRLMSLFAILNGNDYMKSEMLQPFLSSHLDNKHRKWVCSKKGSKIASIIHLLASMTDYDKTFDSIVNHFKSDDKNSIRHKMQLGVNFYLEPKTELHKFFSDQRSEFTSQLEILKHAALPQELQEKFPKGHMPTTLIDALVAKRVVLQTQVEQVKLPSSFTMSRPIRAVIYGLILKVGAASDKPTVKFVVEYDRDFKDLRKVLVEPSHLCHDGLTHVPAWGDLLKLSDDEKAHMMLKILGVPSNLLTNLPSSVHLLVTIWYYWSKNASPKLRQTHLLGLIVCFIKVAIVDFLHVTEEPELYTVRSDLNSPVADLLEVEPSSEELDHAWKCLKKYGTKPPGSRESHFHDGLVHVVSQFQSCFKDISALNHLLLTPFLTINPAHILNGTFAHNFFADLSTRGNPLLFIEEKLGRSSPLAAVFTKLFTRLQEFLPGDCFLVRETKTKKNKKKPVVVVVENDEEKVDDVEDDETEVKINCSLVNRFNALNIEST